MIVHGINPVREALRAGLVRRLDVGERPGVRVRELVDLAQAAAVPIRTVDSGTLQRLARGGAHQGVAAELRGPREHSLDELISGARNAPLILVLDGIEDPQNLGAILRTAEAAGVDGVVRQTRHAAPLSGAVARASAGAVAHVKVAAVVNIARALQELKAHGLWTVGLAADASRAYDEVDMRLPTAVVLGAEGTGLRRLVRDRCDWVARIPMHGRVESLNAAAAAAVALFEAARQRRGRPPGAPVQ